MDDMPILTSDADPVEETKISQNHINTLNTWFDKWKIKINKINSWNSPQKVLKNNAFTQKTHVEVSRTYIFIMYKYVIFIISTLLSLCNINTILCQYQVIIQF